MIKRDLLDDLSRGELTDDEAQKILDEVLDSPLASETEKTLGFSRIEWTAFAHGASLQELAAWRKGGWPTQCLVCGKLIDVASFGWRVIDDGKGNSGLRHIRCPAD
ncbi:hypothetical protein A6U85_32445 [Agrobacterium sp. 13-626]|jgi:hypothetical protein|uniref:hypothetical protein n=1 Tax=Rhizobium rhizogenes TaxID=359 RepID=UPI00080FB577|nr:hypothetical protein [Rhizobium rhizogenes]OCI97156.1 hypothetical protein A6U85_32445 [Agrobacterium sp. 13-626]NTF66279.1 hypothetical protein [Rhizobium rhizogenes]NTH43261.1 hypothetical protein [Rhizobium rhizogenes]NTH59549.1 hypothetical protein [Rhizobium rhizogenes]NTH91178.1 hypothetical protein [Rhizobium rhizogenes]